MLEGRDAANGRFRLAGKPHRPCVMATRSPGRTSQTETSNVIVWTGVTIEFIAVDPFRPSAAFALRRA